MKLKMTKIILSASVLISIGMLTGCAGNAAAGVQNTSLLSAMPASDTGTVKDSPAAEIPGYVDYSVYEVYGLSFDEKTGCYTYNGSIVRFFNDPAAGASFTNFFTGTVDIEAKRDTDNHLIGIKECSQEVYDLHTRKQECFQSTSIDTEPNAAMEAEIGKGNGELLKDYENYGVSYHSQDGRWYYGGDEIRILVDSEKAFVYSTDEKGICFAVSRDGNHNIAEVKTVYPANGFDGFLCHIRAILLSRNLSASLSDLKNANRKLEANIEYEKEMEQARTNQVLVWRLRINRGISHMGSCNRGRGMSRSMPSSSAGRG